MGEHVKIGRKIKQFWTPQFGSAARCEKPGGVGPMIRTSAVIVAGFLLVTSAAYVRALEAPPTADAATVLGSQSRGSNYQITAPVASDGLLQIFTVDSTYGQFTVGGRQLLNRRLGELAAMAALEKLSKSDVFVQSLAKSATSPVKFGRDLLVNPFGTVKQTVTGVSDAFGKVGAGVANPGQDPDGLASSALGVSTAKRQLAAELGVDPYTDFKPLASKLDEIATTVALGGLAPKAAFSAIGGGVGMAISWSGTAEGVRALVRDKTPAQLVEQNRQWMRNMGVDDRTAHAFLENDFYTLTDKTRLVSALNSLGQIGNRAVYIQRAATANYRDLAYFLVRRAEMIAEYQRASRGAVVQFVSAGGFPVNLLVNGRVLIVAPIDMLSWTDTPFKALAAISSGLRSGGRARPVDLRITGVATPEAQKELRGLGWTLAERTSH